MDLSPIPMMAESATQSQVPIDEVIRLPPCRCSPFANELWLNQPARRSLPIALPFDAQVVQRFNNGEVLIQAGDQQFITRIQPPNTPLGHEIHIRSNPIATGPQERPKADDCLQIRGTFPVATKPVNSLDQAYRALRIATRQPEQLAVISLGFIRNRQNGQILMLATNWPVRAGLFQRQPVLVWGASSTTRDLLDMIGDKSGLPPATRQPNTAAPLNTTSPAVAANPSQSSPLSVLKPGTLLNVQVVSVTAEGEVRLQWGSSLLRAQLPPPLPSVGDNLRLQLTATQPQPQLLVLPQPASSEQQQGQWIGQRLPKAQDLGNLLLRLASLQRQALQTMTASPPASTTPGLPTQPLDMGSLQPLIQLLRSQVLSRGNLSPTVLREALLSSGLFLEANLAQGRTPPANDLKLALLQMLNLLQPLPEKQQASLVAALLGRFGTARQTPQEKPSLDEQGRGLLKSIEAALAKVELQQLQSLSHREEGRLLWQFALPLAEEPQHRSLGIEIERDGHNQQDDERTEPSWKVNLHFPFADSGSLDARLHFQGENLRLHIWAEREETLNKVRQALPQLEKKLGQAGFTLSQCQTFPGQSPHQPKRPAHQQPLLREKA